MPSARLERATRGLEGRCSVRLSYEGGRCPDVPVPSARFERATPGFEGRRSIRAELRGHTTEVRARIELAHPGFAIRRLSTWLPHHTDNRAADRSRTGDLFLGKEALYQLSYSRRNERAGNRVRTGDVLLGRQVLYQLSYARMWRDV